MRPQIRRDTPITGLSLAPLNPRLAPQAVNPSETQENPAEILTRMVPKPIVEKAAKGLLPPEEPMLSVTENGQIIVIDGNLKLICRRLALNAAPEASGFPAPNPETAEALKHADIAVYPSRAAAWPAQAIRNRPRLSAWTSHAVERFLRTVCAGCEGDLRKTAEITGYRAANIAGHIAAGDLLDQLNPGRKNESFATLPRLREALQHPAILERLRIDLNAEPRRNPTGYAERTAKTGNRRARHTRNDEKGKSPSGWRRRPGRNCGNNGGCKPW